MIIYQQPKRAYHVPRRQENLGLRQLGGFSSTKKEIKTYDLGATACTVGHDLGRLTEETAETSPLSLV
jgi:hypothetical protein